MTTAETAKPMTKLKNEIVRFVPRQRVEHIVLMVLFIVLSVTGLAQRYSSAGWAEWIIINVGGIEFLRLIHRITAMVFVLQFVYHIVFVSVGYFTKHAKLTMVPTLKDFKDVIDEMRYTFGFKDKPPKFDRFDYRQKFEYWGLMFGSTVLIITGFILMYPVAFTRFLPGQVVAAAVEFHGFEATLAALTIVIWHLYDVIFRPGVFPADTTIFTGRISRERVAEEHPLEFPDIAAEEEAGENSGAVDEAEPVTETDPA
jgi:formate dehydrogenase subunit gamma